MSKVIPFILMSLFIISSIIAYPRLSVEQATPCKSCHINPNGGGARTEFGNYTTALNELCLPSSKERAVKNYKQPRVSDAVLIGFDTRHLVFDDGSVFRMQTDAYLNIEPIKDLQYQLRFWENGINENYALFYFNERKYYFQGGRFYPSFGLRNADHKAYNRERTGHGSNVYLDGIALGGEFNGFSVSAEMFSQNNRGIYGFHFYKNIYFEPISLFGGTSIRISEELNNSNGAFPHAKALFGGISYDRFTLMGEIDFVGKSNDTLISYLNLTTRVQYGLYLIGEYNFFDGNRDLADGVDEYLRLSLEVYPISFFQLRPSYTRYTNGSLKDSDDLFLMVHVGY